MGFFKDRVCALVDSFFSEQVGKVEGLIQNKLDKKVIIKRFEESSKRFFDEKIENSMSIEEINFPALNEYVKKNLLTQVMDSLLFKDKWGSLSDSCFINSCINAAKADTPEKERIVCAYVRAAREIVRSFYIDKNSIELQILLGEQFSNIIEYAETRHAELMTVFDKMYSDIAYINSFASVIDGISPKTLNLSPFHYRNDIITFRGREEEQEEIYSFLDDERKLLWMAITGDGGSGKSKLMYHMTQRLESNDCWKVIWLGKESLQSIMTKDKFEYPINLLFVCDYGGQFAEKLGDFIERLCEFRKTYSEKIRLVILEREGFTKDCDRLLEPMWYRSFRGNISRNHDIDSTAFDKNKSMNLKPLNDNDFKGIMKDYLTEKKKSLSDEKINTIIKKAHEIDNRKTGARPLILLFVADAVADGNYAENWDLNKLVEHVIKRYEDHWKNVICKGDEELFKAVKEITAYATAVGGWNLRNKKIGEPIKSSIDIFFKKVDDKNMFLCSICEKTETDGIWSPFEPDLLGEFFVLEFLRKKIQNYYDEYVSNFCDICWENSEFFWMFLSRCIQNYGLQNRFFELLNNNLEFFEPKNEENILFYCYVLTNFIFYQSNITFTLSALNKLKKFSEQYLDNQDIQISYAKGLAGSSFKESYEQIKQNILEIRRILEKYPENEIVMKQYAIVLFNLIYEQKIPEIFKTVLELQKLAKLNQKDITMQLIYASVLVELCFRQSKPDILITILELKKLSEKYSQNIQMQIKYALGLATLINSQELEEIDNTIDILIKIKNKDKENYYLQVAYSTGVMNKILRKADFYKNVEPIKSDIAEIKKYVEEHKDNEKLQEFYNRFLDELNQLFP